MPTDSIGYFNPVVIFIKSLVQVVTRFFFSDVNIIGEQRIPAFGPVIFFGNHSNQFVDACILLYALPRYPRFLIAESSFQMAVIGSLAKWAGAIGVCRPEDRKFLGSGHIIISEDVGSTETDSEGHKSGQKFTRNYVLQCLSDDGDFRTNLQPKDVVMLGEGIDKVKFTVTHVLSDFRAKLECLAVLDVSQFLDVSIGQYYICPKIDQSKVYAHVTEILREGASIGVFPEGGSHDQTVLLPLKPGMAIMALEAACKGIEDVLLVPLGIFYSSPKDFMSSVTIEVNRPISITPDLIELYMEDRHTAVNQLLNECQSHLEEVMISVIDDEVLQCVKLATSLFTPDRSSMDNETKHQLTHFFSIFFNKYYDETAVENTLRDIHSYSCLIKNNGIADEDVWYLRLSAEEAFIIMMETLPLCIYSMILVGITTFFWGPIRGLASMYATSRARVALKRSTVKVRAFDVMASYKILFIMVLIPLMNSLYGAAISFAMYGANLKKQLAGVATAVSLFPLTHYICLKEHARLKRRIRIMKACLWPITRKFHTFRQDDSVILSARRKVIQGLRSTVKETLDSKDPELLKELNELLPPSLIEADSRRISRMSQTLFDSAITEFCDYKEEML